jgi:hypothetical protein
MAETDKACKRPRCCEDMVAELERQMLILADACATVMIAQRDLLATLVLFTSKPEEGARLD